MNYKTINTPIELIRVGDTVLHNNEIKTVCKTDINRLEGIGITLFGDSYKLGYKPVQKLLIERLIK